VALKQYYVILLEISVELVIKLKFIYVCIHTSNIKNNLLLFYELL
jgi:hypothetical protein